MEVRKITGENDINEEDKELDMVSKRKTRRSSGPKRKTKRKTTKRKTIKRGRTTSRRIRR